MSSYSYHTDMVEGYKKLDLTGMDGVLAPAHSFIKSLTKINMYIIPQ